MRTAVDQQVNYAETMLRDNDGVSSALKLLLMWKYHAWSATALVRITRTLLILHYPSSPCFVMPPGCGNGHVQPRRHAEFVPTGCDGSPTAAPGPGRGLFFQSGGQALGYPEFQRMGCCFLSRQKDRGIGDIFRLDQ